MAQQDKKLARIENGDLYNNFLLTSVSLHETQWHNTGRHNLNNQIW